MAKVDGDISLRVALNTNGVTKQLKTLQSTIIKSLRNALKIGFGVRSIFTLIRKLRTSLIDGFKNLSQVSAPFNEAMSNIMNALANLKSSFASAFSPIIQFVAPALTTFINLIAQAVDKVGMLIAALTGQKEYVKYVATQQDYAKANDSTANSADRAAKALEQQRKAAQKLNRQLAKIDDVDILKEEDDDGSSISYPISGTIITPLTDAFSSLADKIKLAINSGDFTDIGRFIGDKLNEALKNIPWNKIETTLKRIASSIATLFNGFLETPGLFRNIGRTLAKAVNAGFIFVNEYVNKFHWDSLGKAIKDLIIGTLSNIDWNLIYITAARLGSGLGSALENAIDDPKLWKNIFTTFVNMFDSLVTLLYNFLRELHWDSIGRAIGSGIRLAIYKINWNLTAKLFSSFINNFIAAFSSMLDEIPFRDIGYKVSGVIRRALILIDWNKVFSAVNKFGKKLAEFLSGLCQPDTFEAVGTTILNSLIAVLEFLSSFGEEFDFTKFGISIRTALLNLPWKRLLRAVGRLIWSAINAALDFFKGIFDSEKVTKVIADLKDTINRIFSEVDFESISTGISKIAKALEPFVEGFAISFFKIFDLFATLGLAFLNNLGDALNIIGNGLNSIDPKILRGIGAALPAIVTPLIVINGLNRLATTVSTLGRLFNLFQRYSDATATMATNLGNMTNALSRFPLLKATTGLTAFLLALDATSIKIADDTEELEELNSAFGAMSYALMRTESALNLTNFQLSDMLEPLRGLGTDNIPALTSALDDVFQSFLDAGGSAVEFKLVVQDAFKHGLDADQAYALQSYIDNIGNSAETATKQTSSLGDNIKDIGDKAQDANPDTANLKETISAFSDLGWTTAAKIALISSAIEVLSNNGKLSDDNVVKLTDTLNSYNPKKPKESIEKIADAFSDAGISVDDFNTTITTITPHINEILQSSAGDVVDTLDDMASNFKSKGKESGKNLNDGITSSLRDGKKDIKTAGSNTVKAGLEGMQDAGDMHSPSRKTEQLGEYLIAGLVNGLNNKLSDILNTVNEIFTAIESKMRSYTDVFETVGSEILNNIQTGLNTKSDLFRDRAYNIATTIKSQFEAIGWKTLGANIGIGIYNGLISQSGWLKTLAWNTAVGMYNSARGALQIHSPSKKFFWLGSMVIRGLGEGILETEDEATSAIRSVTDAMVDEADKNNPVVTIDDSVNDLTNSLDDVLDTFSDKIVDGFSNLIATLEKLGNISPDIPDIVKGKVIPYSLNNSHSNIDTNSVSNMAAALSNLSSNRITRDDLVAILADALQQYTPNLYLDGTLITRRVNSINSQLNRRFSMEG